MSMEEKPLVVKCENIECRKDITVPIGKHRMTSYCADCLRGLELELMHRREKKNVKSMDLKDRTEPSEDVSLF